MTRRCRRFGSDDRDPPADPAVGPPPSYRQGRQRLGLRAEGRTRTGTDPADSKGFFAACDVNAWDVPMWGVTLGVEDAVLSEEPLEILLGFSCRSDVLDVVDETLTVRHSENSV